MTNKSVETTDRPERNAKGQFVAGNPGGPGHPLKFKTPEELERAIDEHWQSCRENNEPYTLTGLAIALGTDRRTLYNYGERDRFFPAIKRARAICEHDLEKRLIQKESFSPGQIFALKNNHDWVDKQEVSHRMPVTVEVVRFSDPNPVQLDVIDAETVEESDS